MNDEYNIWTDYGKSADIKSNQLYKVIDHYNNYGDYSVPDDLMDNIKKLSKFYDASYVMAEQTLYAVKEQIEWAHRTYMNYNDELNSTELTLLKKVIESGKYKPTDRGLLNEILNKYK
jgi:hypothetical protein